MSFSTCLTSYASCTKKESFRSYKILAVLLLLVYTITLIIKYYSQQHLQFRVFVKKKKRWEMHWCNYKSTIKHNASDPWMDLFYFLSIVVHIFKGLNFEILIFTLFKIKKTKNHVWTYFTFCIFHCLRIDVPPFIRYLRNCLFPKPYI